MDGFLLFALILFYVRNFSWSLIGYKLAYLDVEPRRIPL